ncbi:MAG: redoxin domain-containing protein [Betaproteobacteria bacterium]|nr:MAG: redoxin domain-containing protein [Betaproteobacteria bacterium]
MRTVPDDTMPAFEAGLVGGRSWRLAEEHPSKLALLVFYHGLHCPICRKWLGTLERAVPRFTQHGVSVIALSCDTRERAERAKSEWKLAQLRVGYGVSPEDARKAGLYLSEEPDRRLYTEPGILAVRPETRGRTSRKCSAQWRTCWRRVCPSRRERRSGFTRRPLLSGNRGSRRPGRASAGRTAGRS